MLPAVRKAAAASEGQLGLALLLLGVGALVSMRAAGALIDRFGSVTTALIVAVFGVCALLPAFMWSPSELALAAFLLGLSAGAMDVAIDTDGVREEERSGRDLLQLAHAAFSGAVLGAPPPPTGSRAPARTGAPCTSNATSPPRPA